MLSAIAAACTETFYILVVLCVWVSVPAADTRNQGSIKEYSVLGFNRKSYMKLLNLSKSTKLF